MADAFIGEIRLFPYTFAPANWMWCTGQQLTIRDYTPLYAVIGNAFGGDGKTYFNLPNMQGRVAVGAGDDPSDTFDPVFASASGSSTNTLSVMTVPSHTHTLTGAQAGAAVRATTPAGNLLTGIAYKQTGSTAPPFVALPYVADPATPPTNLAAQTLSPFIGGNNGITQPHENRQPVLVLHWAICVADGAFPVRPD
ncbi:phage tail protein [Azospirillum griseum]|uniref:Phage tail protein n=1 Tax=Azospirillum griseum TaxID=2496639 RepID=A0A3S0K7F3_9PROT|nr:tail fiber protein [Azospirillum griseum]RTR14186.1 phage tail protein [Azospirillum griseum]